MRQIKQRLGDALEPLDADFIEQQRQNNRHREAEQQIQHVEQQGVDNSLGEVAVLENLLEDFQPYKLAAGVALADFVIQKGNRQAGVGKILENDDKQHGQQHQSVKLPVALEVVHQAFFLQRIG